MRFTFANKNMRILTIILFCGLLIVVVISITVRGIFFVRALSLVTLGVLVAFGIYLSRRVDQREVIRMAFLVGVLVLAGLAFTNVPLRLTFAIYESRFEAVGNQLQRGERPDFPIWIGPFRLVDGGIRNSSGVPYLMTSGDPYEINGFVRGPKGTHFNLWSITPVSGTWAYTEED